jgi:dTDP-glucose 4,6-dehydratase
MKILVTGGLGFIGSNFIHMLLENPKVEKIVNVDSQTYAANINNVPINSKLCNVKYDINDFYTIKELMTECPYVVHFAADSHVDNSIASPSSFIKNNINGTYSLLEAARQSNIKRFHHVSTDEVYGSLGETGKFLETTAYDPRSPYSASKASSDHLVRAYYHTYGLPVTISNCSNNYGPRQHPEKLIPKTIINILSNKKVPVYGNGKNIRDWLYVDDHCDAVWKILMNGKVGETYNVGGDCEMTNIQIVSLLCDMIGVSFDKAVEFVEDRKGHDFRYAIDHSKITKELDWNPTTKIIQGMQNTINFYSA